MAKNANKRISAMVEELAITEITVAGFKSISDENSIEIRPLTILAGANSSGKSSMMQPLLLLKQTLEASYDAGPLLLHGPNVKFTLAEQLLSRIGRRQSTDIFQVGMRLKYGEAFQTSFRKEHKHAFRIEQMDLTLAPVQIGQMELSPPPGSLTFWPDMTSADIVKTGITKGKEYLQAGSAVNPKGQWKMTRDRCFLDLSWFTKGSNGTQVLASQFTSGNLIRVIQHIIHVPGLRGKPERTYPATAVGPTYFGTFDTYAASVIAEWMAEDEETLTKLDADLKYLQLAGGVTAIRPNDAQIEIHVGRLPELLPTRPADRVNIADVGVGVSQLLPVLVALAAAEPGQLVYVEQPETHLHPRAQFALAGILANAAIRGVRVVVETHSSILLLGVQTLVAEGGLDQDKVKLHWFQREKDGHTVVKSGDLDEAGRFGNWPEDFDDVMLHAQKSYLDAADKRLFAQ